MLYQQRRWYIDMRKQLVKLGGDLGAMSQAMMWTTGPGPRGAASRVMIPAPTYERFTAPSSRQAFLLGCCHLGCTRFDGVSEAMLQTLLCSGCRRTRYCSVGCQRAAWVEGHGTYCGKA